jgi:hypothetical protein
VQLGFLSRPRDYADQLLRPSSVRDLEVGSR